MKQIFTLFLAGIITFSTNGQGLDFDGQNDYVRIPGHPTVMNGSPFTFEVSIKPRPNGSQIISIATRGNGDPFYLYIEPMGGGMPGMPGMEEGPTSWIIMCDLWSTTFNLNRAAYSINASFFNTWHHIAATYSGTLWTLYVDGVAVSTVPVIGTIANRSADPLHLGTYQGMWNFPGVMDEVRIWNTARSGADITSNMKKQVAPNSTGLVAYYRFNQGVAFGNNTAITGLTDASVTANNATLHNFSLNGSSSNFVEGNPEIVILPLRVNAFTAREENNIVVLNWNSDEKNPFTVERSSNGKDFFAIGNVSNNASGQYQFTDAQPTPGMNVYRLHSILPSGRKEYSKSIVIKRGMIDALKIYPNPASDLLQLQLRYSGNETGSIMDMNGKRMKTINFPAATTTTSLKMSVDIRSLPAGSYVLKVGEQQIKFMKQ